MEKCPRHPSYQGKRAPIGCETCKAFYESNRRKERETLMTLIKEFYRGQNNG